MKERITKFFLTLGAIPVIWMLLVIVAMLALTLPAIALAHPEKIKIK